MNELMIILAGNQWLYFKTNKAVADKALDDFLETAESAGINPDNLDIRGTELRNPEGKTISVFHTP